MHENRETSRASRANRDRFGKVNNHKPDRHAREESDDAIVLMKPPNKEAQASAEAVEGRASIKENSVEPSTCPTPSGKRVSQGLGGVRRVARERKQERYGSAAPSDDRPAAGKLLRLKAERGPRRGRREMERVR